MISNPIARKAQTSKKARAQFLWKISESSSSSFPELSQAIVLETRLRFQEHNFPSEASQKFCPKCCTIWKRNDTCRTRKVKLNSKVRKRCHSSRKNCATVIRIDCARCNFSSWKEGAILSPKKRKAKNRSVGIRPSSFTLSEASMIKAAATVQRIQERTQIEKRNKVKLLDKLTSEKKKKQKKPNAAAIF
eukprot:CAMPEP_0184052404 /NCGR_PEP_ID=MMETSP0956-20121227/5278_1 /TAXON_ID=627963 /ORGANISM="Aplanochytrium sp, Strain PBS07" /LENGTH=189 /DNA_ID=CAMNT_0026345465 /DNA_START=32 /DNA_END=601 /DNA_ORIENTATION=+